MSTQLAETTTSTQMVNSTLLFVDDESNILSSLKRLFRPLGYRIFTATSGHEGLEILARESVDLVISDMRMPEMDGAEFLENVARQWPEVVRILLTGYADLSSTIAAINEGQIYRYISKPWDDNDTKLTIERALERQQLERERHRLEVLTQTQNDELKDLNINLESKVADRTKDLRRAMELLEKTHTSLKKNYIDSIKVFGNIIEMRQGVACGQSRQIADYARRLGLAVGLNEAQAQNILFAALLYDIGKIGLPDDILKMPFHALSMDERAQVIKHPVVGSALIMSLEPLRESATIIRTQHERYDGRGYPDGLAAEAIPIGARILALARDYFTLKNGDLVDQKMTSMQAIDYLVKNSGKLYDPQLVDIFVKFISENRSAVLEQGEAIVKSGGLQAGMVLSRDLTLTDGMLLLARDYELDNQVITQIQNLERVMGADITVYIRVTGGL